MAPLCFLVFVCQNATLPNQPLQLIQTIYLTPHRSNLSMSHRPTIIMQKTQNKVINSNQLVVRVQTWFGSILIFIISVQRCQCVNKTNQKRMIKKDREEGNKRCSRPDNPVLPKTRQTPSQVLHTTTQVEGGEMVITDRDLHFLPLLSHNSLVNILLNVHNAMFMF